MRNEAKQAAWLGEIAATKRTHRGEIDDETAILPHIVADAVIEEVNRFVAPFEVANARDLADELGDEARRIYKLNPRFRKQMRARGNRGRDQLYVWMRHWLCSELRKRQPAIGRKLSDAFCLGRALPGSRLL